MAIKVLKFGGTSVGKPERMHDVAELISDDSRKIVVLSAVSGTTNALVEIGNKLYKGDVEDAKIAVAELRTHYDQFIKGLYSTEDGKAAGQKVIDEHFGIISGLTGRQFRETEEKILLSQGELMSTKLFHAYLLEKGVDAELLPALDFMCIDENDEPRLPVIEEKLNALLKTMPGKGLFITQGYICMNHRNEVDNLKRGGSDYTASLIGAAARASEVQIWTDIDGMHNNDPRIVDKTFPIAELSFDEAAELAYFGAKILHPLTIRPAKDFNIPVKLLNTMDPKAKGTTISSAAATGDKAVKAIAAKDGITAIKIKSSRMLLAYGFMRRIFEIFEKYRTPVDMITTSEVAVSLTIDNDKYLEDIVRELKKFGIVEVDHNQSIICIVGNMLSEKTGEVRRIFDCLDNIPIRMISYGGSRHNISLLISADHKKETLMALNDGLFEFKKAEA